MRTTGFLIAHIHEIERGVPARTSTDPKIGDRKRDGGGIWVGGKREAAREVKRTSERERERRRVRVRERGRQRRIGTRT